MRYLILLFLVPAFLSAQEGYEIKVTLEDYPSDTLLLGGYYWDKQFVRDTAFREEGNFTFRGEEKLDPGMYLLITEPDKKFIQFVLPEEDQIFSISSDYKNLTSEVKYEGSEDNSLFDYYLDHLSDARKRMAAVKEELKEDPDKQTEAIGQIDREVKAMIDSIKTTFPESMTNFIIHANTDVDIPGFEDYDGDRRDRQYRYYVRHYFDPYDLTDVRWSNTSFLFNRVNNYLKNVVIQIPDSLNQALDLILSKVEGNEDHYKLVLSHYLNHYAASEYVGMDAVYVHLVQNYYDKGKAPWVNEDQLAKMVDDANRLAPLLIGKKAPNIKVKKQDGTVVDVHALEANYTILMFWAPDCGHCKKSMPKLMDHIDTLRSKNVEVVAICTKLMEKEATCWEYLEENEMLDLWINTSDKYLQSRFKQKYDVVSTPQVYILDKEKTIVSKKVGVDQLLKVIETLEEIQQQGS